MTVYAKLKYFSKKEVVAKGYLVFNMDSKEDIEKIAELLKKPVLVRIFSDADRNVKLYIVPDGNKILYMYREVKDRQLPNNINM